MVEAYSLKLICHSTVTFFLSLVGWLDVWTLMFCRLVERFLYWISLKFILAHKATVTKPLKGAGEID